MPSRDVVINGRFLAAAPSGVQRVAVELVKAMDAILASREGAPPRYTLLSPRQARTAPPLAAIAARSAGVSRWQAWEQLELPWLARRARLLNLCNVGPVLHPDFVVMMHDAQVFTTPASYGRGMRLWYRALQPALGHRARRVLTVSAFSKAQLVDYGVAPAEKVAVVPNGVDHLASVASDPGALARLGLDGVPFVLALANAQAHKNIAVLLRAFSDTRLRALRLVLVGRASAAEFKTSIPPNAVFAGPVTDGELKGLMQQAVCLAFPSLTEGFGLPPLEAMACGCPALIAPCGALPEVCGDAALYADPYDSGVWAEMIDRLARSSSLRTQLMTAGERRAARYTWAASAQRVLAVLAGLP